MSTIHRRAFLTLSTGTAAIALFPLSGCGGGSEDDAPQVAVVDTPQDPMRAAVNVAQFQALARSHSLLITGNDGSQRRFGGVGTSRGKLNLPAGVAVVNGLGYVVETGNHRVQIFDANGNALGFIGEGELLYPGGIAAGQNELFVADSMHARIVSFSLDGRVKRVIGTGILSAPRGLVVSGTSVFVADAGLRKVLRLGFDGRVQGEVGTGWVLPWDVATDGKNAYVADVSRNELGAFTLSGKPLPSLPLSFAPANVAFRGGALQVTPFA